jgi:hypothetical protein
MPHVQTAFEDEESIPTTLKPASWMKRASPLPQQRPISRILYEGVLEQVGDMRWPGGSRILRDCGRNLLATETAARVRHHVALRRASF